MWLALYSRNMPIKRTAPQADHQVQTNDQMVYRLKPKASKNSSKPTHETENILGVPTNKLYQDLLKTFLTTVVVIAILFLIKWSQVLS